MSTLRLYHGSKTGLDGAISPDRSRTACDFGQGFYMGVEAHQPRTLICSRDASKPTLYTLDFDMSGLRLLRLSTNIDWALFVAFNRGLMRDYRSTRFYRRYAALRQEHDVIFGKIANDRIYDAVRGFFEGERKAGCLLEALQAVNLGDQYCALTPAACAAVRVVDAHQMSKPEIEKYAREAARQRELALARTDQIFMNWRHRDGLYFDEILEQMAKEDAECPPADERLTGGDR